MNWQISAESQLKESSLQIEDFWQQHMVFGTFRGQNGVKIKTAHCVPSQPRGALVLLNGRVETYLKYKEVIYDLYRNGFVCFTYDHRGQGLSERMTTDPQHGYVEDFDHYVADSFTFIEQVVRPVWPDELLLLCHSMGGAIGALCLIQQPQLFSRAVLCSPMFGIKPALPNWLATVLISVGLKANRLRKKDSGYFFGQKSYTAYPFQVNPLTHSKIRYNTVKALYEASPDLQIGGVTSEWLAAAHQAMLTIEAQAERIVTPTLVLSSGHDLIIDNNRQRKVVNSIPDCTYLTIEHAFHELLTERDDIRNPAMQSALDFLTGEPFDA